MVGITSYGGYVPLFRLSREAIAKAWGGFPLPGEKAAANYDEDSVTMAVAAVLDCLGAMDCHQVGGLYFASTSSPYKEKLKDSGFAGLGGVQMATSGVEPQITMPGMFGLSAARYFHTYGLSYEQGKEMLAKIAVKNHYNGALNPKAHFRRAITLEQALNAPLVAWPLGLFDCCPVTDGAAVAIITRREPAKSFGDFVLVKGLGLACGANQGQLQDDYDFVHFEENIRASRQAYQEAGIKDPFKELDHAEVHDCFTITEAIIYEDLGFCPRGQAKDYVDSGVFTLEGELAVNPDGGLKSFGHPIGASGIRMLYEVYKQLLGKAGPRQRKSPELGLAHNLGGLPGSFTCSVIVLGR